MDRNVALLLALTIGAAVAAQGPMNSQLGRSVGGLPATLIALSVSAAALLVLTAVAGQLGGLRRAGDAPLWALVGGGLVGALYVGSIVWTVRALGVAGLTVATLSAQLAASLVIDHFGWLGVERAPITVAKLAGVGLLAAGTYLVIQN